MKMELRRIKYDFIEEKKRYSGKNKRKIKKRSKELLKFFNEQEKEMKSIYEGKIAEKEKMIKKMNDAEEEDLFKLFTMDEKINYIRIGKRKGPKLNSYSSTKDTNLLFD